MIKKMQEKISSLASVKHYFLQKNVHERFLNMQTFPEFL